MYVIRADRLRETARAERAVDAVMFASGRYQRTDGSTTLPQTAEELLAEFDAELSQPLNWQRMKAAVMREVSR